MTRWVPDKTEAGGRSHVTFVMLMTATAYRLWNKAQTGAPHQPPDQQSDATSQRVVQPNTGKVTPRPARANPWPSHLVSIIFPPPQDSGGKTFDVLDPSLFGGQGLARRRREMQRENREKVIVFMDQQYGIFDMHALLILASLSMTNRYYPATLRHDILRHYDCDPEHATNLPAHDG